MTGNDVLDLDIRRKIYNYILKSPGLHEREISRELNIALSTLDYHLYYLKKRNLLRSILDGRYTRYYVAGDVGSKDKKLIAVLRQPSVRKIILFLLLHPHSSHKAVCKDLGLSPSTTSFHLNKLVDLEIASRLKIGKETSYNMKEPEYVSDLLITYKKSFLDKAVDQFVDTWFELHPKYIKKSKDKNKSNNSNVLLFLFTFSK